MQFEIQQYASGWELCHRIQAPLCTRYSLNMPLSLPSCRWERLTMHFIPDLPASMGSRYTGMSVIIDCLTDVVTYIPCKRTLTLQSWHMLFEQAICKRGVPASITTCCSKQYSSYVCDRVCSHLSINHRLSTAFHLQMDAQTEGHNRKMNQYLGAFCNYEQDNWVTLLPLVDFAYNISIHQSTLMTPFWVNWNYHPTMQLKPPLNPIVWSQAQADS